MGVQFILGPAGVGKTQFMIDSVASDHQSQRCASKIIIVPDQATYQTERMLISRLPRPGFTDIHVLSFRRLALRIIAETGGTDLPFVSAVGRSMATASILFRLRKDLKVFGPLAGYPGFRDALVRSISELSAFQIDPEVLVELVDEEEAFALSRKLNDLSMVYRAYKEFLAGKFLDPDDYLSIAAERARASCFLEKTEVWIDGFSGFTPREYSIIRAIMKKAEWVRICLTVDPVDLGRKQIEDSTFFPVLRTFQKLKAIVRDENLAEVEPLYLMEPLRFGSDSELGMLEEYMRSRRIPKSNGPVSAGSVELVCASNPRAECEFVARDLLNAVRDSGLRFRDITVQVPDMEEYGELLASVFRDHGIPHFVDAKGKLSHHPLAELVRASLDAVLTDLSFDSVMRYLKTDLVPCTRYEADFLENYALAHGVKGKAWIQDEPWTWHKTLLVGEEGRMESEDQARRADAIRVKAVGALKRFYQRLKKSELTATEVCSAISELIEELQVQKTLERWAKRAQDAGDLMTANEHIRAFDGVMQIIHEAATIMGDQPADIKSYALLIDAGLEDLKLGAIPPSLDQVLIGDLSRTRFPMCKVSYVMGAVEGKLPRRHQEDPIFCDRDREYLLDRGIELDQSARARQLSESYSAYVALTRPAARLVITYPLSDSEGRALQPSYVVTAVKRIFPGKSEEYAGAEPSGTQADLAFLVPGNYLGSLVRRLSLLRLDVHPGEVWLETYRYVSEHMTPMEKRILASLGFVNVARPLGRELAEKLFGFPLATSVSRLERFRMCPFMHYAGDGLRLEERDVFELDPSRAGTFFHDALRLFCEKVLESGFDFSKVPVEVAQKLATDASQALIPNVKNEVLLSSARYKYVSSRLTRTVANAAVRLIEHAKRGSFRPVAFELGFGLKGINGLPGIRVELPDGLSVELRGRIDRVDVAAHNLDKPVILVRVVDYKSSAKSLKIPDVYYGISLQLLVYLLAIKCQPVAFLNFLRSRGIEVPSNLEITPAGAFYFPVIDPIVSSDIPLDPEKAREKVSKEERLTGIFPADVRIARLMDRDSEKDSDLVDMRFTQDGVGKTGSGHPPEDFQAVLDYASLEIQRICREIYDGRIDIAPYRKGTLRACTICPYSPLCGFDILVEGNKYRVLSTVKKDEAMAAIRQIVKGDGEDK